MLPARTDRFAKLRADQYARRYLRRLWNVLTLSETARAYPDVALRRVWQRIPVAWHSASPVRAYGQFLHRRACASQPRRPTDTVFRTFFFRNAPQFEVLRELVLGMPLDAPLRVAAVGCSSGAELYSALWVVRTTRSDLRVTATGLDLDEVALRKAESGTFARGDFELSRLTDEQVEALCGPGGACIADGDVLTVAPWVRAECSWLLADVRASALIDTLGPQEVVFANNILCHMHDAEAEACLRSIAALVAAGGHLFMFGVDLDLKVRVLRSLGFEPVRDRVEEAYLADDVALARWPHVYWSREPIDSHRRDWALRYAAVYKRST